MLAHEIVRRNPYNSNLQCARPRGLEVPRKCRNEDGEVHQLYSMYIPFDAALLYGRLYRSRRHL